MLLTRNRDGVILRITAATWAVWSSLKARLGEGVKSHCVDRERRAPGMAVIREKTAPFSHRLR